MTLKTTVSLDGKKRVNRRITHRLDALDFENFLCLRYTEHDLENDGDLPDLSRSKILEIVDHELTNRPDARYWWTDHVEDDDFRVTPREWATELIRRRFPEFY